VAVNSKKENKQSFSAFIEQQSQFRIASEASNPATPTNLKIGRSITVLIV